MKHKLWLLLLAIPLLLSACVRLPIPGPPIVLPVVVANFAWAQDEGLSRTIHFDASGSTSTEGEISFYTWYFTPIGLGVVVEDPAITHGYTEWGTFTVRLVVVDSKGNTAEVEKAVVVSPLLPVATFSFYRTSTQTQSLRVEFDGSGSTADGNIVDAYWWFGDGDGKEGPWADTTIVRNTYPDAGTYFATLTIVDQHGQESTKRRRIRVPAQPK